MELKRITKARKTQLLLHDNYDDFADLFEEYEKLEEKNKELDIEVKRLKSYLTSHKIRYTTHKRNNEDLGLCGASRCHKRQVELTDNDEHVTCKGCLKIIKK